MPADLFDTGGDDGDDLADAIRRSDRYEATSFVGDGTPKRSLLDVLRGR